jgi:hypothetical protein
MKRRKVKDGFERMWKKAAVASFKVLSRNLPGETEKSNGTPLSG